MKITKLLISLLLCIIVTVSLRAQRFEYYPDNSDTVKFDRDEFFTFLWPKSLLIDTPLIFTLTPVYSGQLPDDAINNNQPLYIDSNVTDYYINYPWYLPDLDTGTYVWQISDYESIIQIPRIFIIKDILPDRVELFHYKNIYAYLKEQQDATRQVAYDKWLYIHYKEPYWVADTQKLRFRVLDVRRNVVANTDELGAVKIGAFPPIPVRHGDNWLIIKLESCAEWNKSYTLEVWNAKGEILVLPFYCTSSSPYIRP
jgi:hypothetical protein